MKIGFIGEGETEFNCLPTLISKFGHQTVGNHHLSGVSGSFPWEKLMKIRIFPYLRGFAVKKGQTRPDKVLIVIDREKRGDCCGLLSTAGHSVLKACLESCNLDISFAIVLPNPTFESWLFSQPDLLDNSPLFDGPISHLFPQDLDSRNALNIAKARLKAGKAWDKPKHGKALAQRIDLGDATVASRSRSLRKFIKEISLGPADTPANEPCFDTQNN